MRCNAANSIGGRLVPAPDCIGTAGPINVLQRRLHALSQGLEQRLAILRRAIYLKHIDIRRVAIAPTVLITGSCTMIIGRRRFLGTVAGTAATVLLPRGVAASIAPFPGSDSRAQSVLPPESMMVDPLSGDHAPALLPRALAALDAHRGRIADRNIVGLVDFSVPSRLPRLHIVDIAGGRVVSSHLVAHGRGSDPANTGLAERFSNRMGSEASSNGSFVVGDTYMGKHGRSRRLVGLDPENDQAEPRGIVIHSAPYVCADFAAQYGRVGRSEGCFAVSSSEISSVLELLGPGRLLYAAR